VPRHLAKPHPKTDSRLGAVAHLGAMEHDLALDTVDYTGRRVLMSAVTWIYHIQARHPDMAGRLLEVEETLHDPSFVHEDRNCAATHLYYRLGAADGFRCLYLLVVVRCDIRPALVLTAHLAGAPSGSAGRLVYVKARH
jgi:hypothetical protein